LHVHPQVRDGLRAIDEHARAIAVSYLDHLARWRDGAEGFRHLAERHQPGARTQELLVFIEHDLAAIVHGGDAQAGALLGAQLLPRHDVGVMLQPGDHDLVVLAEVLPAPALGDQIDGLGRTPNKNNLVAGAGVEEAADLVPRSLVSVGGARRQFVGGPVDVGVLVPVEVRKAVDDSLGLLGGGGVIQPDQRPAMHALRKNGEIAAHGIGIKGGMG